MKKIIFFLLIASICFSCVKLGDQKEVMCTDEFSVIDVTVQYPDGSPVALDSIKVLWGERDITHIIDFEMNRQFGRYPIVDDALQDELEGISVSITAYGYLDGKEVFKEDYLVGADECHIAYTNNKPRIITIVDGEVMCTEIFLGFGVRVQYPDSSLVELDSYKVLWGEKDITDKLDWELSRIGGRYPLVDDGLIGELRGLSVFFTAYGYLNGKEVFKEDFLVGADKCHVAYYGEKPLTVTIDDVACTEEFRSIGIKVQYPDGSPVVLDSFKVAWVDRDMTDRLDWELYQTAGLYPLIDDGLHAELKGLLPVYFTVSGYLDEKLVYSGDFLVGAEKCHVVYYDRRPPIITIEKE
jgi:hypothetical protein